MFSLVFFELLDELELFDELIGLEFENKPVFFNVLYSVKYWPYYIIIKSSFSLFNSIAVWQRVGDIGTIDDKLILIILINGTNSDVLKGTTWILKVFPVLLLNLFFITHNSWTKATNAHLFTFIINLNLLKLK